MPSDRHPDFVLCISRTLLWQMAAAVAALVLLFYAGHVVLIVFAGILLATILRGLAGYLEQYARVPPRWSYALTFVTICAAAGIVGWFLAPRVFKQVHQLAETIPRSFSEIKANLERTQFGDKIVQILQLSFSPERTGRNATTYAKGMSESVTDLIVIVAIGLFVGSQPGVYRRGLLFPVPESHRSAASVLLDRAGSAMQSWLLGQLVPMAALGIGTFAGLEILAIPLAFTLALLTALLLFVPYAGAVLAFIPAVLVALSVGLNSVLWVTAVYLGVHIAEGYILTPLVQKKAVRLPPALTLSSQLLMWKLAGILGLLVATPLAAACLAVVQALTAEHRKPLPDLSGEDARTAGLGSNDFRR